MREGQAVKAARELSGGWGSSPVKAGSKGVIVKASMFSNTYTVTFTDQGWGNKTVTIENFKVADLRRA